MTQTIENKEDLEKGGNFELSSIEKPVPISTDDDYQLPEDEWEGEFELDYNADELIRMVGAPTTKGLQSRDKIVFFLGVTDIICLSFFLHGLPWIMPWFYILKAPILILIRVYQYFQCKCQYFLIDFCYFANLLLMIYIVFFPENKKLFTVIYSICHGPLAWAVCLFHNSLVFHSLDKMTSAFIHISPLLVTYSIRWFSKDFPESQQRYGVCDEDSSECSNFIYTGIFPILFYIAWILLYGFSIKWIIPMPSEDYLTSFRFLTRKGQQLNFLKNISFGWLFYAVGNVIVTFIMLCPTIFFYHNQILDFLLGVIVISVALWNGAGYYIHVFSKRYEKMLQDEIRS
jgi:hypothetical protein